MNFHNVKGASIFALLYQCVLVLGVEFEGLMSYAKGASFTRFSLVGRRPMLTVRATRHLGRPSISITMGVTSVGRHPNLWVTLDLYVID